MVVVAASVFGSALTAMFISSIGNEVLVPLMTSIPLAVFLWMILQAYPVRGQLRWQHPTLSLQEGRRVWQASVTQTELVPWVLPGVGTVQGSILILHTKNEAGLTRVLHIAATEVAPPAASGQANPIQPDMWIAPQDLRNLIAAVGVKANAEATRSPDGEHRFQLVRRPSSWDSLAQLVPWFGTMAILGVAGVLFGESVAQSPAGQIVFGLFSVLAIAYGIRRTMKRAGTKKPAWTLVIRPQLLQLIDAQDSVTWGLSGPLHVKRSNYVYRTKYSSHRLSVLHFGTSDNALRIGVWDPRYTNTAHPDGPAPQYLVGAPDWIALQTALQTSLRASQS